MADQKSAELLENQAEASLDFWEMTEGTQQGSRERFDAFYAYLALDDDVIDPKAWLAENFKDALAVGQKQRILESEDLDPYYITALNAAAKRRGLTPEWVNRRMAEGLTIDVDNLDPRLSETERKITIMLAEDTKYAVARKMLYLRLSKAPEHSRFAQTVKAQKILSALKKVRD